MEFDAKWGTSYFMRCPISMSVKKWSVVLVQVLLFCGFAFADSAGTFENRVRVEFESCSDCGERILYLPEFGSVEVPSEAERFIRNVSVELCIDAGGLVTEVRPRKPDSFLHKLVANELLKAIFTPIAKNGDWVSSKLVINFKILPIIRGAAYKFVDIDAVDLPMPDIPDHEAANCTIRYIRVLVEFDQTGRGVQSALTVSGDEALSLYAELAALKARFRSDEFENQAEQEKGGILEYRIPRPRSCSIIVSRCNINTNAIELVMPVYSDAARFANIRGSVSVSIIIDEDGWVIGATANSGPPLLRQSAVSAAMRSKFHPTKLSGVPVRVRGIIVYNFK